MMIKIQNNVYTNKDDRVAEILLNEKLKEELYKIDIDFGNFDNPDYVFALGNDLKDPLPNTIAWERIDGCQIRNKSLLKHPNILRMVKTSKYVPFEVNNLPCLANRIFTRFLVDENDLAEPKPITEIEFKKVVAGFSFLHYVKLNPTESYLLDKSVDNERSIDIFFAGTTSYGGLTNYIDRVVSNHRLSCLEAVKKIEGNNIVAINRVYNQTQYLMKLYDTKIIVSPWGYGEACYRDFEALACGCEVIKPYSYDMECNPNIYTDEFIHPCKPDWSDLEYVVNNIREEYDQNLERRIANNKTILEARSFAGRAKIIENIIKEVKHV